MQWTLPRANATSADSANVASTTSAAADSTSAAAAAAAASANNNDAVRSDLPEVAQSTNPFRQSSIDKFFEGTASSAVDGHADGTTGRLPKIGHADADGGVGLSVSLVEMALGEPVGRAQHAAVAQTHDSVVDQQHSLPSLYHLSLADGCAPPPTVLGRPAAQTAPMRPAAVPTCAAAPLHTAGELTQGAGASLAAGWQRYIDGETGAQSNAVVKIFFC